MQVPMYNGPQVNAAPVPQTYENASDYTIGSRALGQAADQGLAEANKIVAQQNQDFAWRADAQMKNQFAQWEAENKPKFQGAAAVGTIDPTTGQNSGTYAQAVQKFWDGQKAAFGSSLSRDQQRIIDRNVQMYSANTVTDATRYVTDQLQKSHQEAYVDGTNTDVQTALHTGTPAAADVAAASIMQRNAQFGLSQGHVDANGMVDADWLKSQNLKSLTSLHVNMIGQLQQSDPAAARQYFNDHKDQIDGGQLDNIDKNLNTAEAAGKAVSAVSDVFTKYLPANADPSHGVTPLNVTAMMGDLETQFKGNPTALAAARAELGARVSAWKTTEQQFQDDATNTIEAGIAQGRSLSWAMAQPAWGTLAGKQQDAIKDHLEAQANAALSRANALDARQDAAAARHDRALGLQNYSTYLDLAGNPDKLAGMSNDQINGMLPTLGTSLTHSLLEQKTRLNTAGDVRNAKIDNDTFTSLAVNTFGIPAPETSKAAKAAFGLLHDNVNFVLQQMQTAKGAPLTQEEKATAMRNEMARTVTVDPGWFSSNVQTPVVALSPAQVANVVVPPADRAQIADALKALAAQHPNDPQYAPTDANMRALYLRRVSPAGKLFNGQ